MALKREVFEYVRSTNDDKNGYERIANHAVVVEDRIVEKKVQWEVAKKRCSELLRDQLLEVSRVQTAFDLIDVVLHENRLLFVAEVL